MGVTLHTCGTLTNCFNIALIILVTTLFVILKWYADQAVLAQALDGFVVLCSYARTSLSQCFYTQQ